MRRFSLLFVLLAGGVAVGCSGDAGTSSVNTKTGGTVSTGGGSQNTGGTSSTGGASATGGVRSTGGVATGGVPGTGGLSTQGGTQSTGGTVATGGVATGGRPATGGVQGNGGATGTGGSSVAGGTTGTGGSSVTGGVPATGGQPMDAGMPDAQSTPDARPDTQVVPDASVPKDTSTTGYQPCINNPCKILPFGDSITFGVGDEPNGGYRGPLFASIVAAGQKVTFTGSMQNGPSTVSGQTFPKRNEGHSGWGISTVTAYSGGNAGIASVLPSPAFSAASGGVPDIVLLHIGTNDASSSDAAIGTAMATRLDGLIAKIYSGAPDTLLVVAKILPVGWASAAINAYNQAIPGLVTKYSGQGKHIVLVDMNTGFNASTMFVSDNLHPNTNGYKFMADKWYAAIKEYLPK